MLTGILRTLVVAAVVICFVPLTDAQGGRGGMPPLYFTFTNPKAAADKDHTLLLGAAGNATATFDVYYRQGGGGGGMGGFGGGFCAPGSKVDVEIDVSPATGVVLDKKVASFDVGYSPSVPMGGGTTTKVSKDHKLTFALDAKNATSGQVIAYNLTFKSLKLSSGNCAPAAPTLPQNAGKAYLNVTFPVKAMAPAVKVTPKKDAASVEFLGIAMASLVGFALRRPRNQL